MSFCFLGRGPEIEAVGPGILLTAEGRGVLRVAGAVVLPLVGAGLSLLQALEADLCPTRLTAAGWLISAMFGVVGAPVPGACPGAAFRVPALAALFR